MKRILKKLLVIILILLMLNNFCMTSVHAANEVLDAIGGAIGGLFSGVVGILTYLYRAPAVMIGWLVNRFMTTLAYAEGSTDPDVNTNAILSIEFLTVFDILFNKVKILSIDFFDLSDTESLVGRFRVNVAAWFYIMRNISAGILLVILVYIGIRMAISTVASDRAMYKRMLADWTVSLLLIFVLNYIIIFTIEVNNAIVNAMAVGQTTDSELATVMKTFGLSGITPWGGIPSIVAAIIYVMLIWQTMGLFFSYFNRMLKIAFLIIIAPLISLTYSIDKIGDGKAQALDAWLKEFVFTILMQPFHCAIYMSLISTAIKILTEQDYFTSISNTLGAGIIALVCITFTKEAEKIIRKIFAFKDDNKGTSLAAGAVIASATLNKAKNFGTGGAKFVHGARDFIKDGKNSLRLMNVKAETIAAVKYLSGKNKDKNGEEKDYKVLRSEEREKAYSKKAIALEHKEDKLIGDSEDAKKEAEAKRKEALNAEIERLSIENNGKMTDDELKAVARFNVAKSRRPIGEAKKMVKKKYTQIKDGMGKVNEKIPFSETRALLTDEAKKSAGFFMAAGTFGLSGKVSGAATAGIATNQAVEEFSKNNESRIAKDVDELLESHTEVTEQREKEEPSGTTDPEDKVRDKKSNILNNVLNHSSDYDLEGDTIPDKLKDIIKEINDACKDMGAEPIGETEVKQTIKNSKNPKTDLDGLLETKLGKEYKTEINEDQKEKIDKLMNYGTEYAISQKFSSTSNAGVSSTSIVQKITEHKGEHIVTEDEKRNVSAKVKMKKSASDFVDNVEKMNSKEINHSMITGDKSINPSIGQIQDFSRELEQYERERKELESELYSETFQTEQYEKISEFHQKAMQRQQEFERKKALLIARAVNEVEDKKSQEYYDLCKKAIADLDRVLQKEPENKDELSEIKVKLEKNIIK